MNSRILPVIFIATCTAIPVSEASGQSPAVQREIEKAGKEILPRATKAIEEAIDAKLTLEVDVASFGEDPKAWGNLNIIASRVVAALSEVGKDQVGKDAIAGHVRKVVISKIAAGGAADSAELKDGTLTVRTVATDDAVALLQGVTTRALEKAFQR